MTSVDFSVGGLLCSVASTHLSLLAHCFNASSDLRVVLAASSSHRCMVGRGVCWSYKSKVYVADPDLSRTLGSKFWWQLRDIQHFLVGEDPAVDLEHACAYLQWGVSCLRFPLKWVSFYFIAVKLGSTLA